MKVSGFKDTIAWYNNNATQYAKNIGEDVATDQIEEFIATIPSKGNILDAGCAAGRDSRVFQDRGFNVTGVDLSPGLLEIAQSNNPDIHFVEGDFRNLPFEKESFDGIWSHASLLHLETQSDVKLALTEFNRILKFNGVLHVLVKEQTTEQSTAVVSDAKSGHDRFFQYFTPSNLTKLLDQSGFNLIKIDQYIETDRFPNGRPEVKWILSLSRKSSKLVH